MSSMEWSDLTTTFPDDDDTDFNHSTTDFNFTDDYYIPYAENIPVLMNVTRDVPLKYAMPLFGYIMPFLLIITVIANTLIVVVLSQRHMRTPTNLVLLAMAISDMLTLFFPAPWYFYMYTLNNHANILFPPTACYAYHTMIEAVPAFFHTASIWLTLLLAVQRYVYVCHPTIARTWCTVPKVLRAMAWVYVFAMIHQSTRFFDRVFEAVRFRWRGGIHEGCVFISADWVRYYITENIYYTVYYGFRILFVHIGPCLALVIFNVLLCWAMRKAQLKRKKLLNENRKSECKKLRDSNCTTFMLIAVVTVFLAVEIPLAVTTLLHIMQNALDLNIADYDDLNSTILFTNFFIIVSYPVNFAIYCGMSRQFRETFKDVFLKGKVVSGREGSSRYSLVNGPRTSTNETIL
ncbi:sex peptide receptor-like [Uloborus diversus]|uniref:sex peptide receptor-like n=1 Tax=Uloborus diversus TaxID=327109 RepID=UPI00240991AE|nr:sex peptide receptor-like [Uloborus diversus]